MIPLALAALGCPNGPVPAPAILEAPEPSTASTSPAIDMGNTGDTGDDPDGLSPLPVSGCPYPLDLYWDLAGWDGPQFWGSFEEIPGGFGCHLWVQADRVHQVDLIKPSLDWPFWAWSGGVTTSAYEPGSPVLIEGLPDGPWVLELR